MKKGFTTIEILAIIVLIATIYMLVFPATVEFFRRSVIEIDEKTEQLIISQTKIYVQNSPNAYPKLDGSVYCISVQNLKEDGYLSDFLYDAQSGQDFYYDVTVKVTVNNEFEFQLVENMYCHEKIKNINFTDQSGATQPKLFGYMVPVIWNEGWITADPTEEWYNYNEKHWANVVLVTAEFRDLYLTNHGVMVDEADILAHFVWIPRYRYKLFNSNASALSEREIAIQFENNNIRKSPGENTGEWLTHPAFTYQDEELSGFWAGKFITTGDEVVPTIRANRSMLVDHNTSEQKDIAALFGEQNYGLTTESKLISNLEWGALAYLSQSKYGNSEEIWINPNNQLLTGCAGLEVAAAATSDCETFDSEEGVNASSTGNVYGVYDMSGGAFERTLAVMENSSGDAILGLNSGFGDLGFTEANFLDIYQYGTGATNYNRRILGDATGETRNWYGGSSSMPFGNNNAWFLRGGTFNMESSASSFAFETDDGDGGNEIGFRVVILAK